MYGRKTGLIEETDEIYVSNQLLELFNIDGLNEDVKREVTQPLELPEILDKLLGYAYEIGLLEENSVVYQDLFDTKTMELAVLPARLNEELEKLKVAILNHVDIRAQKELRIHADWVEEFLPNYKIVNEENIKGILEYEVGKVFTKVLEHVGVYKRDESGHAGFMRFIETLKNT